MGTLAGQGKADEIMKLWGMLELITKAYIRPMYISYLQVAKALAIAGNPSAAAAFYKQARAVWEQERDRYGHLATQAQVNILCARAQVLLHSGHLVKAAEVVDLCHKIWTSRGLEESPTNHRVRGEIYEGTGKLGHAIEAYQASIKQFEQGRSSYAVTDRIAFFRSGPVRKAYWGLIRATAKRASVTNEEPHFLTAVQATERIRARQLGELLDPKAAATISLKRLRAMRKQLDSEAAVLDYILTDNALVLLAFTRDRNVAVVSPYDRRAFRRQLRSTARVLADPSSDQDKIVQQLSALSGILLGPVSSFVQDKSRLYILPDGALNLIPFDQLTISASDYRPLVKDKVVQVVPSLRFLRSSEQMPVNKARGLFALGDPSYAKASDAIGLTEADLHAATRGHAYLTYFAPLPETRTEVEAICVLFSNEPVTVLLGDQATESMLKGANLQPYRYVHLATHGILGGDVPGIGEPALVLGNEEGEDGFLKASEAEQFTLTADLTVLSACKTGTGKYVTGEGVMGMSRAFLIAGSRAVLVSLWSVESKATEELMVRFYRHLRTGMETVQALRQAKLELMEGSTQKEGASSRDITTEPRQPLTRDMQHPAFWAPFVLVGK